MSRERKRNPSATAAFWFGLIGLVLMPIPLFIGFFLGGGLALIATVLAVIGLFKSAHTGGRGIAMSIWALVFVALTFGGISIGGGIVW